MKKRVFFQISIVYDILEKIKHKELDQKIFLINYNYFAHLCPWFEIDQYALSIWKKKNKKKISNFRYFLK